VPGRSFRVARIAGIPVGVSPWWLVVLALFTWVLGDSYFPEAVPGIAPAAAYGLGLATVLLLFASILAHEFGHALVARRHGIEVEEIDLWLLGGVARMRGEAHEPNDELGYALAGPAVTALVAAAFTAAALLLPASAPAEVRALVEYQAYVNVAILVLNLLPAFPLDGGRALRALLWRHGGDLAGATRRAAAVGTGFGYVMIALGVLDFIAGGPTGLWLSLIGFFIVTAARQEAAGVEIRETLGGLNAGALMSTPVRSLPADSSISEVAASPLLADGYVAYPVTDREGRAIGLISATELLTLARGDTGPRPVGEYADRDPGLLVAPGEDVTELLARPAFARSGRAVVIDEAGRPLGLLSVTDLTRVLSAGRTTHAPDGSAGAGRAAA
jgi:Zn-dependent protease